MLTKTICSLRDLLSKSHSPGFLMIMKWGYGLILPLTFFLPRIAVPLLIVLTCILCVMTVNLRKLSLVRQQYPTLLASLRGKTFLYALPFMLWATFTCIWSPYPMNSLTAVLGFISLIICSMIYAQLYSKATQEKPDQGQVINCLLMGGLIIAMVVLLDYFMGGWWAHYKNTSTAKVYVKLALSLSFMGVVCLHFIKRIPYKILYMLVIFCALQRMDCDTALLAYLVGLVCYGAMSFSLVTKIMKYCAMIGLPLVMLTLPTLITHYLEHPSRITELNHQGHITNPTSVHRLYILRNAALKIQESPLQGFGFHASRYPQVNGGQKFYTYKDNPYIAYVAVHPHNYIMQLWQETGLIGVLLWLLASLAMLRQIFTLSPRKCQLIFALFACGHIHLLVSIGLWESWWWAYLALLLPPMLSKHNS